MEPSDGERAVNQDAAGLPVQKIAAQQAPSQQREGCDQTPQERDEERRMIRRLQMVMNMVMSVIAQDTTLTVEEASQMIADSKRAAMAMFPDKELAYNLIYKPRFQRLMHERFRIQ